MALKSSKFLIIVLLASVVFLATAYYCIHLSMNWLLEKDAQSTGNDWAQHIEMRLPHLPSMQESNGLISANHVPDTHEFTSLVSGVLAVGNIYQIDFINPDCYCTLSLGSYDRLDDHMMHEGEISVEAEHNIADGHNHVLAPPSQNAVEHLFKRSSPHKAMQLNEDIGEGHFPLDRKLARSLIEKDTNTILIHSHNTIGDMANQPTTFAEIYHPVLQNGEALYMLRVLVNLEERAHRYSQLLYLGTGFIILLLIIAFSYPAIQFLRSSKKQRAANAHSHYLASHDILTGLYNRNAFQVNAPFLLDENIAQDISSFLILVDVNNFKEINDYYGHGVGDEVLRQVATALDTYVGNNGLVARIGGDEFAIVLANNQTDESLEDKIGALSSLLEMVQLHDDCTIDVSLCASYARFPCDGDSLKELMRHADLAMQYAKRSEERKPFEYKAFMSDAFTQRVTLLQEFRSALQASQIIPYYQPLVNMHTGCVEGFEALARWNHPEKGVLTPASFHEALDDRELGELIGAEMLKQIMDDMGRWQSEGVAFKSVALNVCEGDLMRPTFAMDIVSGLTKHKLERNALSIEVTENCIYGKNTKILLDRIHNLRALGCNIALDDFGTGYSSITHIRNLPCTAVKVDKSFVDKVVENGVDQAIVSSLISLGRSVGFKLVLEGIETGEQLKLLRSLGCDIAQGFYYSKPVPASDVPALVDQLNDQDNDKQGLLVGT